MDAAVKTYQNLRQRDQRDALIFEHLEYVRHVVDQLIAQLPDSVDVENLESAGILGLVESANQYDPSRGASFTTFAYLRIRGAVLDELRRNCPLSQQMLRQIARLRQSADALSAPATPEALAHSTGMSVEEVEECLEAIRLTQPDPWSDAIASAFSRDDRDEPSPLDEAELADVRRTLALAIQDLPDKERDVVTLYYLEDLRLKEIAEVMNLSPSRISRLLSRAEFRLRQSLQGSVQP